MISPYVSTRILRSRGIDRGIVYKLFVHKILLMLVLSWTPAQPSRHGGTVSSSCGTLAPLELKSIRPVWVDSPPSFPFFLRASRRPFRPTVRPSLSSCVRVSCCMHSFLFFVPSIPYQGDVEGATFSFTPYPVLQRVCDPCTL